MVRFFSRDKTHVAASPLPAVVAESLDMFRRVWPLPVKLVAYTPTSERVMNWERETFMGLGGLLLMTEDLIVYSCLEVVDTVPWVSPLARMTGAQFFEDTETLVTRCGHPTERGKYLQTQWELPTRINGPEPDQFALNLRNLFFEQLDAHLLMSTPTEDELWPPTGELGVGAEWVTSVVDRASTGPYPPLAQLLGDHRRESRMPPRA